MILDFFKLYEVRVNTSYKISTFSDLCVKQHSLAIYETTLLK